MLTSKNAVGSKTNAWIKLMKLSAGILLFRIRDEIPEFFLVHPGGPFFRQKNEGWWTVPKGEPLDMEEPRMAAIREFEEETGYLPAGEFLPLTPVRQKGGKLVQCWAVQGDLVANEIKSNTFNLEWPPRSGQITAFPEIDKGGWFDYGQAVVLINERQISFLEELAAHLSS